MSHPHSRTGLYEEIDRLQASCSMLIKRVGELSADRDEWKQQHENLLEVHRADLAALAARIKAQPPEELPHWHPVCEQPKDEDCLFVVRDADGQCAFAVRYEGKWEHTADADCGPIAEWFALPPASSSPQKPPAHEWTVDPIGGHADVTPEDIATGWPVKRPTCKHGTDFFDYCWECNAPPMNKEP